MKKFVFRNIRLTDIAHRETDERAKIQNAYDQMSMRKDKVNSLSAIDKDEYISLSDLVGSMTVSSSYLDPLFCSVRYAFGDAGTGLKPIIFEQTGGLIAIGDKDTGQAETEVSDQEKDQIETANDADVARIALVIGLLQKYGTPLPKLTASPPLEDKKSTAKPKLPARPKTDDPNYGLFIQGFYKAAGRVASRMDLAVRVLKLIASAVEVAGDGDAPAVSTLDFADVFEKLVEKGVAASDPNLKPKVDDAFSRAQDLGSDRPMHETLLVLPDLDSATDTQILAGNVQLIGPIIFASMFEELKVFQVVDRLVEMSQRGTLSLTRGKAGTRLYQYWRDAPNRMSESERQTVYAMTLGLPTGEPGVMGNADFQELWLRFVSSVSTLVRENRVDQLIRSNMPASFNQQLVKKAGRDLAANMSLHGFGMAFYAAADLNKQINEIIELLDDAELKAATGSRDIWGVIDQIAQTELGGARNSYKYRMLANSGGIITNWLSQNVDRMLDSSRAMIDLRDVEHPPQRLPGESALSYPKDYDLVSACEVWLADSAMGEQRVDQMSQPKESPQQTSRPIQIPSIARDLLEGTGLGLGMSAHSQPQYANGSGYPAY